MKLQTLLKKFKKKQYAIIDYSGNEIYYITASNDKTALLVAKRKIKKHTKVLSDDDITEMFEKGDFGIRELL